MGREGKGGEGREGLGRRWNERICKGEEGGMGWGGEWGKGKTEERREMAGKCLLFFSSLKDNLMHGNIYERKSITG